MKRLLITLVLAVLLPGSATAQTRIKVGTKFYQWDSFAEQQRKLSEMKTLADHEERREQWIIKNFGDQKIAKNRQKYKKHLYEKEKKERAEKYAAKKGKVKTR